MKNSLTEDAKYLANQLYYGYHGYQNSDYARLDYAIAKLVGTYGVSRKALLDIESKFETLNHKPTAKDVEELKHYMTGSSMKENKMHNRRSMRYRESIVAFDYKKMFYTLLKETDNLECGPTGSDPTEYSAFGFYWDSQTGYVKVNFDPETEDYYIQSRFEDDSTDSGYWNESREGTGWNHMIKDLWVLSFALFDDYDIKDFLIPENF